MDKNIRETKDSFDNWAESYDAGILTPLLFKRIQRKIVRIVGELENKDVLDVGCGTGSLIIMIYDKNKTNRFTGVDISENMIEAARKKTSGHKNIEFIVGKTGNLPFDRDRFDYVISSVSFHHWPEHEMALKELYDLVKPSGKLLIADLTIPQFGGRGTNAVVSSKEMSQMMSNAGFGNIKRFSPSSHGRYGVVSAVLGIPIAVYGVAMKNPAYCITSAAMIAGGIIYSIPDWTSQITVGEKI
ncbi:MAG: class I SAM-dependent methyltransferase [Nanoarchaeota archaeon]